MTIKPMILVAEKNSKISDAIYNILHENYEVIRIKDEKELFLTFEILAMKARVVILNLEFSALSKEEVIKKLKSISLLPEIIILSNYRDMETAVSVMKLGAFDYLIYPFEPESLLFSIENVLNNIHFFKKIEELSHDLFWDQKELAYSFTLMQELILKRRAEGDVVTVKELLHLFPFKSELEDPAKIEKTLAIKNIELDPPLKATILIIEDDEILSENLREYLIEKYSVYGASNGESGLRTLKDHPEIDIVLLDIFLPDSHGVHMLDTIHHINPATEVIVISAYKEISTAVEMIRKGAVDYLNKPFLEADILITIAKTLQRKYFQKLLLTITSKFMKEILSDNEKMKCIYHLYETRKDKEIPIYMKDIYQFFPDIQSLQIPETVPIPNHIMDTDFSGFISDLRKQAEKIVSR